MTDAPNSSMVMGRSPRAALAAIAIGLGGLAVAAFGSDRDFATGLDRALAVRAASPDRLVAAAQNGQPPVVGSEDFWLARASETAASIEPASFVEGISRGDRFEFAGAGGKRMLEVVDVRSVDAGALAGGKAEAGPVSKPQLLVSFRDVGADAPSAIRMLVDANAPIIGLTPVSRQQHRAL